MTKIEKFIVRGGDNYNYLVISDREDTAIAIDPLDTETVCALAEAHGVKITHVLITHGHDDHTGGATIIAAETGASIIGHKDIAEVTQAVGDGEKIVCGTIPVATLETPGHTYDSICYLVNGTLFTGDTVFFAGAGNCYSGDAGSLYESFVRKLFILPDTTKLAVGHEYARKNLEFALSVEPENFVTQQLLKRIGDELMPESTLGEERKYNPFFRITDEQYIDALEKKVNQIITDPKEAFLITRELRNRW